MRFEDLEVWKRASRLSVSIYIELKDLKDYGFNLESAVGRAEVCV